jgi:hypothetical protein
LCRRSVSGDVRDVAGPVIEAPRSGKRVRYLETADGTGGEYARFETWLAPLIAAFDDLLHLAVLSIRPLAPVGRHCGYAPDDTEYRPRDGTDRRGEE